MDVTKQPGHANDQQRVPLLLSQPRRCGSVYLGVVVLTVCEVCYVFCMRDTWVVQWYCIFEGLVELCKVVGVELQWKLIGKIMGVVL